MKVIDILLGVDSLGRSSEGMGDWVNAPEL